MHKIYLFSIMFLAMISSVQALTKTFNGHVIEIIDEGTKTLFIDGDKVLSANYLNLYEKTNKYGYEYIRGSYQDGGASCEGSEFFIVSKPDGSYRFDLVPSTCFIINSDDKVDHIVFSSPPTARIAGQNWRWDPVHGIRSLPNSPTISIRSNIFEDIYVKKFDHPSMVMNYSYVKNYFIKMAGNDYSAFESIFEGPGTGKMEGDWLVVGSCRPHDCLMSYGMIFINGKNKTIYAIWHDSDHKITSYPKSTTWQKESMFLMQGYLDIYEDQKKTIRRFREEDSKRSRK